MHIVDSFLEPKFCQNKFKRDYFKANLEKNLDLDK